MIIFLQLHWLRIQLMRKLILLDLVVVELKLNKKILFLSYYNYLITKPIILNQFNNDPSQITYDTLRDRVLGINVYYDVQ